MLVTSTVNGTNESFSHAHDMGFGGARGYWQIYKIPYNYFMQYHPEIDGLRAIAVVANLNTNHI